MRPYSEFPKYIDGPTVWKAADYADTGEAWTHRFTTEEIAELSEAGDRFITSGRPLTGMARVSQAKVLDREEGEEEESHQAGYEVVDPSNPEKENRWHSRLPDCPDLS